MRNNVIEINVANVLPKPYGRYIKDDKERSAEAFRKTYLVQNLRNYDKVKVNLSDSNRFTSSFLEEAFGGLVRSEGFSKFELEQKLIVEHKLLPSIVTEIWYYIDKMEKLKGN